MQTAVSPHPKHSAFTTWKTIHLGIHKSANAYREALKKGGCKVGPWADNILGRPAFRASQHQAEVHLVIVSVPELGFNEGARYDEIGARALELGLTRCSAEVGPALRLAYKNQPRREWLTISMKAITDSVGDPGVFRVGHDDEVNLWLKAAYGRHDDLWDSDFIFTKPK